MRITEERNFTKLSLSGIILGIIGSIVFFIGAFIPYSIDDNALESPGQSLVNSYVTYQDTYAKFSNIYTLIIIGIVAAIMVLGIISLLGQIKQVNFGIQDEKPLLVSILAFIFAPIIVPVSFTTCLGYVLAIMRETLYMVKYYEIRTDLTTSYSIGAGLHLTLIGGFILVVACFLLALTFLWKRNLKKIQRDPIDTPENTNIKNTSRIMKIVIACFGIVSSVGAIIGLSLPYNKWVYRTGSGDNQVSSFLEPLLTYHDWYYDIDYFGHYVHVEVIYLMLILALIFVASILVLLGNFNVGKIPKAISPLCFLILIPLTIPGFSPYTGASIIWQSPFLELLWTLRYFLYSSKSSELRFDFGTYDEYLKISASAYILMIAIFIFYILALLSVSLIFLERKNWIRKEKQTDEIMDVKHDSKLENTAEEKEVVEENIEKPEHEFDEEAYENSYKEQHY